MINEYNNNSENRTSDDLLCTEKDLNRNNVLHSKSLTLNHKINLAKEPRLNKHTVTYEADD